MTWTAACLAALPFALIGAATVIVGLACVVVTLLVSRAANPSSNKDPTP